jgi:hypothetical protein
MTMFREGTEERAAQEMCLCCFGRELWSLRIRTLLSKTRIFG